MKTSNLLVVSRINSFSEERNMYKIKRQWPVAYGRCSVKGTWAWGNFFQQLLTPILSSMSWRASSICCGVPLMEKMRTLGSVLWGGFLCSSTWAPDCWLMLLMVAPPGQTAHHMRPRTAGNNTSLVIIWQLPCRLYAIGLGRYTISSKFDLDNIWLRYRNVQDDTLLEVCKLKQCSSLSWAVSICYKLSLN